MECLLAVIYVYGFDDIAVFDLSANIEMYVGDGLRFGGAQLGNGIREIQKIYD